MRQDLVKRCLGDLQYRGHLELDEIRQQATLASQALQVRVLPLIRHCSRHAVNDVGIDD